jgi:hypothetical protein
VTSGFNCLRIKATCGLQRRRCFANNCYPIFRVHSLILVNADYCQISQNVYKAISHLTQSYMSPHTKLYVTTHKAICHLAQSYMSPHTKLSVTSHKAICHLTQSYMSPHTKLYVTSHKAMSPHTKLYVTSHKAICHLTQDTAVAVQPSRLIKSDTSFTTCSNMNCYRSDQGNLVR